MSMIYYCKFENVVLDLSNRYDIIEWLKVVKEDKNEIRLPNGMSKGNRCEYLGCCEFDYPKTIELEDLKNVKLDFLICNKNKDDDIEELIFTLKPYIKSGTILYTSEEPYGSEGFEVDLEKTKKFPYLEFIPYEKSFNKYKSVIMENYEIKKLLKELKDNLIVKYDIAMKILTRNAKGIYNV